MWPKVRMGKLIERDCICCLYCIKFWFLIPQFSRYMLMTGRYSMKEHKDRRIMKDREPTLGKLFKDNGYTTGIFGKAQPLQTQTKDFQSDVFRSI